MIQPIDELGESFVSFWSSVVLTGDPTAQNLACIGGEFWSSVVLTGDPTKGSSSQTIEVFWSSVVLTGDPTTP